MKPLHKSPPFIIIMRKYLLTVTIFAFYFQAVNAQLPKPTIQQVQWHDMDFYLFTHFGPNTFTDKEWGEGTEKEEIFNPSRLDCMQWCKVAKASGAKGIIITAKHHDGFCLWPSKYSTHTVRESKWKNGKGDVLKELSIACKANGLKFGVYISPWDRNHPDYGTPKYNDVFVNMMTEIFSNYGPIWELWWDGANGEGPNGKKQVYDWDRFKKLVNKLSPNTVVFSDIGPHIRWVGNERGIAGETNWNTLDTIGFSAGLGAPPTDTLNRGNVNGKFWIPAECDVSIRPGWFYHKEEDDKVKTPEQLFDLYLKSVGRGATLLLNVPPDRRGLIHENDSVALVGFKKLLTQNFRYNLCPGAVTVITGNSIKKVLINDKNTSTFLEITDLQKEKIQVHFKKPSKINCIVLKEFIKDGQSVQKFSIEINSGGNKETFTHTTIGHKRIITFPAREADDIVITFLESKGNIKIAEVEAYLIEEGLVEKIAAPAN
ncbi:MAG: alpha-L-fucosidase [Ferruginibacter sp.]